MQDAATPPPSDFAWNPPPAAQLACKVLQGVLNWLAIVASVACCCVAVAFWREDLGFLGIFLCVALWVLAVAVHEGGHVLGARASGMTVFHASVGRLEFKAQRRGWRVRWNRKKPQLAGLVVAFPDPRVPMRAPCMLMTVAGPAANALVGGLCALLAAALWERGGSACWLLLSFASINLPLALTNLLPTQKHAASDGLMLLRWLRARDEAAPELVFARLNGLSAVGTTADQLPPDQVALLETQPAPMPLVHLWFVLKADQNRLDWHRAAALHDVLEERVAAMPVEQQAGLEAFIAQLRCEIRFSRAMAGIPNDAELEHGLDADADWHYPTLRLRCRALTAARAGDAALARQLLEQTRASARQSVDLAMEKSEHRLCEAVLAA
ncbi:zinc metalloprotease [Agrilutibacter solisilvae]|uniref:Peptidase M50 domain-containing protein n=1 Tax=Agrilutibacter solisilvae TaxID=2763317 RepID=A0A974Y021_9GAMM|nr:hypothetical protein [Lysobacter solisilvae]QSX77970.1 hypothetical protein I8J32_014780 [Lysobacter solisilvae]